MKKTIVVEVSSRQSHFPVDQPSLVRSVKQVIAESDFDSAEISVTLVNDQEMHSLNNQFLEHDYPTDVLSFPLSADDGFLAGEIIVSVDTAIRQAGEEGVTAEQEILLYVIHGCLHLVGYDDKNEEDRILMRQMEKHFMEKAGWTSNSARNVSSTGDSSNNESFDNKVTGNE